MHSLSGLGGTPLLVGPNLLVVCPSGWCWCLSTSTGGHHCRGGGLMVCPSRTRTARTSPCPPAPWVQGSVSRADVFHPLTELLEHGYKVRFLVMKNKAQLKESMVVILQWSSGHSVVVCSGSCLGLGLKTGLFHYYISGSRIILNAIHWENFWRMRRWFIMQRCFR